MKLSLQDIIAAASSEGLPAVVASSLLLIAATRAPEADSMDWLQSLNATAQEVWERGTGSLSTRAATLLKEAGNKEKHKKYMYIVPRDVSVDLYLLQDTPKHILSLVSMHGNLVIS